jgi:hypothetical protein
VSDIAFQCDAFQNDAFQTCVLAPVIESGKRISRVREQPERIIIFGVIDEEQGKQYDDIRTARTGEAIIFGFQARQSDGITTRTKTRFEKEMEELAILLEII